MSEMSTEPEIPWFIQRITELEVKVDRAMHALSLRVLSEEMGAPGGTIINEAMDRVHRLEAKAEELERVKDERDRLQAEVTKLRSGDLLWREAVVRADIATARFGLHESPEFTLCRLAEEVGELVQAATSRSKGRDQNRAPRVRDESIDVIAMVIRLLREWPNGKVS